jgi:hypothetical protein
MADPICSFKYIIAGATKEESNRIILEEAERLNEARLHSLISANSFYRIVLEGFNISVESFIYSLRAAPTTESFIEHWKAQDKPDRLIDQLKDYLASEGPPLLDLNDARVQLGLNKYYALGQSEGPSVPLDDKDVVTVKTSSPKKPTTRKRS